LTTELPFRFRPPWWAFALAVLGCAAGIALGNWQAGRGEQKRAAAATLERISLRGEFLAQHTVLLDNKLHLGRAGYHVVQPLRTQDGKHVLVNRGWVAMQGSRELLPALKTPPGVVTVAGVRKERFARAFEASQAPAAGPVRQNISTAEFSALSGLAIEPWVVEQHSALDDGLVREWPRVDAGVEKHASYALQWYSLAGLSVVLFLALNFKRAKKS
jgi:surfeit locus 1 family protein